MYRGMHVHHYLSMMQVFDVSVIDYAVCWIKYSVYLFV
jgi:hypothetical protein